MTLNEIYESIAKTIIKELDNTWVKAVLNVEYHQDAAKFKGIYRIKNSNTDSYFKINHMLFDYFEELNLMTTQNQKNNWNRAKFTLEPDGNFDIEFEWDQGLADEIERLSKED